MRTLISFRANFFIEATLLKPSPKCSRFRLGGHVYSLARLCYLLPSTCRIRAAYADIFNILSDVAKAEAEIQYSGERVSRSAGVGGREFGIMLKPFFCKVAGLFN